MSAVFDIDKITWSMSRAIRDGRATDACVVTEISGGSAATVFEQLRPTLEASAPNPLRKLILLDESHNSRLGFESLLGVAPELVFVFDTADGPRVGFSFLEKPDASSAPMARAIIQLFGGQLRGRDGQFCGTATADLPAPINANTITGK